MKYRELYEKGYNILAKANIADATIDARLLLEFVCHTDRNYLYAHGDEQINDIMSQMYELCINKRAQHIPLQHITGQQEFMGLNFFVNENVLIPRQDTEVLVEEAMLHIEDGGAMLDLCTGSGCVLISVARYKNDLTTIGADISPKALEVAKRNADNLLNTDNCQKPVFIESNLFDNIDGKFDIITANPPYIKTEVIESLEKEVKEHDPMLALDGGEDGLDLIKRIVEKAPEYLVEGGWLLLEIGYDQGDDCKKLFNQRGFVDVLVIKDLAENDRVVIGRYIA